VEFGVHLPLIGWPDRPLDTSLLGSIALLAERAGYATLCANDHLTYPRPWLDGPTALAAVAPITATIGLMTTVALPVVRGPFAVAKTLAGLDLISGGRVVAGLGPGSSPADQALAGLPFDERWVRFDEAVQAVRWAWRSDATPFEGRFYRAMPGSAEPRPFQPDGPPIWIGSWGSDAGLRRVARLADGWLASAYNTTPERFSVARSRLSELRAEAGLAPLPNALATGWLAITRDRREARAVIDRTLLGTLGRPAEELAERSFIGPEALIADRLAAYSRAGLERVFLWPVEDELAQVERFAERILPGLA
jgi:alkanesulfonate monooxygenase SsuD/methylene tetrahydromethanopterin reductase-like flavin-dependent oxidoreductase (luciferase family)